MGKAEKGTPKDIGKRIKAKGLQKLKFYCQMCEKQCRDANGFKCHMTSESHLRQMKIFSENAKGIMDRYSRDFESGFLQTLRQRHTTKRVNANNVYQEVIQDKQHIHMNSTRWATLSDFVMYLGKKGRCVVDETERGWYVQYIENDAGILERKERQARRAEAEKAAEIAQADRMERQRIEAAKMLDRVGGTVHLEATNMERKEGEDKSITVALAPTSNNRHQSKKKASASKLGFFDDEDDDEEEELPEKKALAPPEFQLPRATTARAKVNLSESQSTSNNSNRKRPKSPENGSRDSHPSDSKRSKKKEGDKSTSKQHFSKDKDLDTDREEQPWLKRDIIVRIITKKLQNGKYFRKKAVVDQVLKDNTYCAEVAVLDDDGNEGDTLLRLDQNDLETVVPKEGKKVRILKGDYRGRKAKLVFADKKKYRANLKLVDDGELLEKVDFEDFSQLA